jgi:hypothetical protein
MSGFCKKLVSINSLPELILFTISLRVLVFSALRLFNHSSFLVYNFFSNSPDNQLVTQPDRVRKQDARLVKIAQPLYKFFPGKFCFSLRGTTNEKKSFQILDKESLGYDASGHVKNCLMMPFLGSVAEDWDGGHPSSNCALNIKHRTLTHFGLGAYVQYSIFNVQCSKTMFNIQ